MNGELDYITLNKFEMRLINLFGFNIGDILKHREQQKEYLTEYNKLFEDSPIKSGSSIIENNKINDLLKENSEAIFQDNENESACYLEELGISGDTMIDIKGGSIYICDILIGYKQKVLQDNERL